MWDFVVEKRYVLVEVYYAPPEGTRKFAKRKETYSISTLIPNDEHAKHKCGDEGMSQVKLETSSEKVDKNIWRVAAKQIVSAAWTFFFGQATARSQSLQ